MIIIHYLGSPRPTSLPDDAVLLGCITLQRPSGTEYQHYYSDGNGIEADRTEYERNSETNIKAVNAGGNYPIWR